MALDTEQSTELYATVAGGVLWGLARLYIAAFSPTPPKRRDVLAACAETTCALIAALIGGKFVAPAIIHTAHITDISTIGLVCVLVGLGFWQSVPFLRAVSVKYLEGRAAVVAGVKPPENVA